MGWWNIDGVFEQERKVIIKGDEILLVNGDGPSDILVEAFNLVRKEYIEEWKREPTKEEFQACIDFNYPEDLEFSQID